jgi:hypothetical protein
MPFQVPKTDSTAVASALSTAGNCVQERAAENSFLPALFGQKCNFLPQVMKLHWLASFHFQTHTDTPTVSGKRT